MKIVLKIGGAALESAGKTRECVVGIATLVSSGHHVAVVHGGGAALTRLLARLGKQSEFVNGLRVTDEETRDAALMVLSGLTNRRLVAAFQTAGVNAVGLSGADGASFVAEKKPGIDLGFVGRIAETRTDLLHTLWQYSMVPVFCSMAAAADGDFYNINADEMAAACAAACKADLLLFLTDVDGVRGSTGQTVRTLPVSAIATLQSQQVISGGMLPKLSACSQALAACVSKVRIFPADMATLLASAAQGQTTQGTEVLAS